MRQKIALTMAALAMLAGAPAAIYLYGQQRAKTEHSMADCPAMQEQRMAGMNERGDKGMGFSQEKATHHFFLTKDGGLIQVEANAPSDTATRDQIRRHLRHITMKFAEGDFETPMFVHERVPPGVQEMQRRKEMIAYRFEEIERGGRVHISSADQQAVAAIQSFLRFQITEHVTHDPLEVGRGPAQ